jgi:hypothetical protein
LIWKLKGNSQGGQNLPKADSGKVDGQFLLPGLLKDKPARVLPARLKAAAMRLL